MTVCCQILLELTRTGKLARLRALDLSYTAMLTEAAIFQFIRHHGHHLEGLMVAGKPRLAEQFFLNIIPYVKNVRCVYTTGQERQVRVADRSRALGTCTSQVKNIGRLVCVKTRQERQIRMHNMLGTCTSYHALL